MQISKINNQSFGAHPCKITKKILLNMEENGIDTSHIIKIMRESFIGETIKTKIFQSGMTRVDMYDDKGNLTRGLIHTTDGLTANSNTASLLDPEKFAQKLFCVLNFQQRNRSPKQRYLDTINTLV